MQQGAEGTTQEEPQVPETTYEELEDILEWFAHAPNGLESYDMQKGFLNYLKGDNIDLS